jgi:hypothetical protein
MEVDICKTFLFYPLKGGTSPSLAGGSLFGCDLIIQLFDPKSSFFRYILTLSLHEFVIYLQKTYETRILKLV